MSVDRERATNTNIKSVGCFADYAYTRPELRDKKYYNYATDGQTHQVAAPPSTNDTLLPNADETRFVAYADGPTRYIPSIDHIKREEDHPRKLREDEAIQRCYAKAKVRGQKYFALQEDGVCFASNDPRVVRNTQKLEMDQCSASKSGNMPQHKGANFTNRVFEIQDLLLADDVIAEPALLEDMITPEEAHLRADAYEYDTPQVGSAMDCADKQLFDLSKGQKFSQSVLTPDSDSKGLLSYRSPGFGKTCEALNVAGNFMSPGSVEDDVSAKSERWRTFWVTRAGALGVPDNEMFQNICVERMRAVISDPSLPLKVDGELIYASDQKIKAIRSQKARRFMRDQYGLELLKSRVITYETFIRILGRDLRTNGWNQTQELTSEYKRNIRKKDFGYKTLFIFDEPQALSVTTDDPDSPIFRKVPREGCSISETTVQFREDVYGPDVEDPVGALLGRDLIPAMLYASYRMSGRNSAKAMFLSATPDDAFWLLNMLIQDPKERLPTKISDAIDPLTLSLRADIASKFASIASRSLVYIDQTKDPTKFPVKLLAGWHRVAALPFHTKLIHSVGSDRDSKKVSEASVVAGIRRRMLFATLAPPFFSPEQLQKSERMQTELAADSAGAREARAALYIRESGQARKVFGFVPSEQDEQDYRRKKNTYLEWQGLSPVQDAENPSKIGIKRENPKEPKKKKAKNQKKGKEDVLEDGDDWRVSLLASYGPEDWEDDHQLSKSGLSASWGKDTEPNDAWEVTSKTGALLTLTEWYVKHRAPLKDWIPKDQSLTPDQRVYEHYLIVDPSSQKLRLRTMTEFIDSKAAPVEIELEPKIKQGSLAFTSRKFSAELARSLLPFYAPLLHKLINNILATDTEYKKRYGVAAKHAVFTFSQYSRGSGGGANDVLSAFKAFPDKFEVLTTYAPTSNNGAYSLVAGEFEGERFGVATLSSGKLPPRPNAPPNAFKEALQQRSKRNQAVTGTLNSFDARDNIHGDRIKVLVIDGAFVEGIDTRNVGIVHFLDLGNHMGEMKQAAGRFSRGCRSNKLPFIKGLGAVLYFHFYELYDPITGEGFYKYLLEQMSHKTKLGFRMHEVFETIAKEEAMDAHLTRNIHDFEPTYAGVVVDDEAHGDYYVDVPWPQCPRIIVSADRISKPLWDHGQECRLRVKNAWIKAVVLSKPDNKLEVLVMWEADGGSKQQLVPVSDIRLPLNTRITFAVSSALDLMKKYADIGAYKDHEQQIASVTVPVNIGSTAAMLQNEDDLALGYASDPAHLFLGLLAMTAMLRAHPSTAHAPMTIVLPPQRGYPYTPRFYDFAVSWEPEPSGGRNLKFQPVIMQEFLKAKDGISVLFLVLRARDRKKRDHVNMLIYHPLSMTIERFSGLNNVSNVFDTVALDSRLGRLFKARNSSLTYMALTNGGVGIQTILDSQRVGKRLGSFEGAILLLYMQTRVMHIV